VYLLCTSSATAVWNRVLLRDVPEICRTNLLTLDLGDGWSFFDRWSRFLYFSARCSTFLNWSCSFCSSLFNLALTALLFFSQSHVA
jgi:hypothetical protein